MTSDKIKRKLTAILSADVKGYSRLMGEDEEWTLRTLNAYKGLIQNLVGEHRGRVVASPGDNVLAEFASVVDAVECAVGIQQVLRTKNALLPETRKMDFRIGINLGDVIEEGDSIYGDGVNIAARLEGLAEAGGICISESAYQQIENKIPLRYDYLGEHAVKNIARPVKVYRARIEPEGTASQVIVEKKPGRMRLSRAVLAGIALVVIAGAAALYQFALRPSGPRMEVASKEKTALPVPDKPSIAVLPFTNMSGDREQEYFSDGITEDLITDISKIRGLFVIARNSVFTYKGKPVKIPQVAKELGVRYVMEGSVRREGDQLRINAQLIDASTDRHIWAERYDGTTDKVFALQDSITQKIVSALKMELSSEIEKQRATKETNSPQAYDNFLRGWAHYRQSSPESFAKAITYFEKAVKLDPEYSRAYAALALIYWEGAEYQRWKYLDVSYSEAKLKARKYLKEAHKAPTPLAHSVASLIHKRESRYEEAISEATHAIALDSSDPIGYRAMADALLWSGNPLQSTKFISNAMRLDPNNSSDYLDLLGIAQFNLEQFEKAASSLKQYIKRNPDAEWSYLWLAATYGHLGRKPEAFSAIKSFNDHMEKIAWNYMSTLQGVDVLSLKEHKDAERLREGLRIAGVPLGREPVSKATKLISKTKEGNFEVEGATTIEVDIAKSLIKRGVVLIDVRPDSFWNNGHIPGAKHIKDNEVFSKAWLSRLAREDQEIILYCEGAG